MENTFSEKHPELIGEWSDKNLPLTPDAVTYGSKKIVWWQGVCGHEWQTSVKARSAGEKCPICSGARVVEGINDLATLRPEIALEWSEQNGPLRPTMVTVGSNKKVLWKGKCGHEWEATIKSRTQGSGCPYCSHNTVLAGFNDLASQHPEIAAEWSARNYPLQPSMVTAFANRKAWWECKEGHEWNTLISTRSGGSKCPYCSGISLLKGFNDFATRQPQLAAEWSERNLPLMPDMINERYRKNVWWKCGACGNEWRSLPKARIKGTKCPVCADRVILPGVNDLATSDAHLLDEWDFERNKVISPERVSRHSKKRAWWKCSFGHSWNAKISERAIEGVECKECEAEFQRVFPRLVIKYYAAKRGLSLVFDTDRVIGVAIDVFFPEEKLVLCIEKDAEAMERVKKHLCEQRGIKYTVVTYSRGSNETEYAQRILKTLQGIHIFISTDAGKDVRFIRERFLDWKARNRRDTA